MSFFKTSVPTKNVFSLHLPFAHNGNEIVPLP